MNFSPTDTTFRAEVTGIRFPDQGAVVGVETPNETIFRRLLSSSETAQINATIPGAEGAFGGDVIVRGGPDHFPRGGIHAGGVSVVFGGKSAASFLLGIIPEVNRVVEFSIKNTDAVVPLT